MKKRKGFKAWLITWEWSGNHAKPEEKVVFEAIVAFNRDRAGFHVQDHVTEAAAITFVTIGNKNLKMFLQMREVGVMNFAFFASVVLGRVALDVFACAFIA